MSGLILNGDTSGSVTLNVPAVAGSSTVTLPAQTGNIPVLPTGYALGAGDTTRFKNRIINGDMRIDQRNNGASVTASGAGETYTLDRWSYYASQTSKFTVQQNAGSVTPPVGFTSYLGITSSSSYSITSSDWFTIRQSIEGFNGADLGWGTANAKTVTLSFWVRSSLTGTFGGSLRNGASNYSYPFSYSIPTANTWTQVSITIAGPTAGTWVGATNGTFVQVFFGLGVGSSNSGTAGSWAATSYGSATGATSVVGTNGATFYITGVQLEVGSQATSFEYVDYGTQLQMCQRYYAKVLDPACRGVATGVTSGGASRLNFVFPTTMRAAPSLSSSGTFTFWNGGGTATSSVIFGYYGYGYNYCDFDMTLSSSFPQGQACAMYCGNSSAYLIVSAEL